MGKVSKEALLPERAAPGERILALTYHPIGAFSLPSSQTRQFPTNQEGQSKAVWPRGYSPKPPPPSRVIFPPPRPHTHIHTQRLFYIVIEK